MRFFRALGVFLSLTCLGFAAPAAAAFNAAVELYNQHKPLEAQRAFEALAQADPDNADISFYLGRLALQRDDYEQATPYLEKAVVLKPDDGRFHLRLGDAYGLAAQKASLFSQLGLARKCRREYEKAVALDPRNIEAHLSLMSFYQQAPGFVGGGLDKALVEAQEVKKLDVNRGRIAVAGVYVADQKYDQAFAEFETVLKEKPDDYAALFQFGRLAAISGQRLDEGLAALRRCLGMAAPEGQPTLAAAHWRIGNILEKKGDKAGARTAYEAALKADPRFAYAADSLRKLD